MHYVNQPSSSAFLATKVQQLQRSHRGSVAEEDKFFGTLKLGKNLKPHLVIAVAEEDKFFGTLKPVLVKLTVIV